MKIVIKKSFQDDLSNFEGIIFDKIDKIIDFIENNEQNLIFKFLDIGKIKGYKTYYRIRIGDYRVGIKIENSIFYFVRIKLRKDIYKVFP